MIDKSTILFVSNFENQYFIPALKSIYEIKFCKTSLACSFNFEKENVNIAIVDNDNFSDVLNMLNKRESTNFKLIPTLVISKALSVDQKNKLMKYSLVDFLDGDFDSSILLGKLRLLNLNLHDNLLRKYMYLSEHDIVTGLYNNHGFTEKSKLFIKDHQNTPLALVIVEIGKFDLYFTYNGLEKSLELIKYLSSKITSCLSGVGDGIFARYNPNKFIAIIPFDKKLLEAALREIKESVVNYDSNYFLLPKACINVFGFNEQNLDNLLNLSTLTLNRFVANQDNYIVYYSEELKKKAIEEQEIINDMQRAIDNHEFQVYLQPKYISSLEKPYGAEALVRWIHPKKGMINPAKFIPLFEANGSIAKLDLYVWEQVCILIRKWLDQDKKPAPISVNMSRLDAYNVDVVAQLKKLVDKHHVPIDLLHIEVTESAYIEDFKALISTVKRLKKLGFKIYVDDFGAGYTSIKTLNNAKIDVIKFDQSLLDNNTERGKCIIKELVSLAKSLNIKTVMEGVENEDQVAFFKNVGCDFIQGYYFARPMPIEEYESMIENYEQMDYYQEYFLKF